MHVNLRTCGGAYLCAENGGGGRVTANRFTAGEPETFTMMPVVSYPIKSGDQVQFVTSDQHHYLCAEDGGGRELVADRLWGRQWETFTVVHADGQPGEIRHNDHVGLRAFDGSYVCAEMGGEHAVVANRKWLKEWETFVVEEVLARRPTGEPVMTNVSRPH